MASYAVIGVIGVIGVILICENWVSYWNGLLRAFRSRNWPRGGITLRHRIRWFSGLQRGRPLPPPVRRISLLSPAQPAECGRNPALIGGSEVLAINP
jgi:hypothetical protein